MPDLEAAARRWVTAWERAWPARDPEPIAALYAEDASYRALAFREPDLGLEGVRRYLRENLDAEEDVECRFGDPIVAGDRAAVEWWASWIEDGRPLTLAGVTVLRFRDDGKVVDHRDYWNRVDRREPPYAGW
jgi:ketosteroid isomerase-like protein